MAPSFVAYRSRVLHFTGDPSAAADPATTFEHYPDGVLVVQRPEGTVAWCGPCSDGLLDDLASGAWAARRLPPPSAPPSAVTECLSAASPDDAGPLTTAASPKGAGAALLDDDSITAPTAVTGRDNLFPASPDDFDGAVLPVASGAVPVHHYPDGVLVPGFIDTHIHYPQTEMVASYGEQLLEWLDTYTFPTEEQFGCPEHAADISRLFLDELTRNGTTTALVFGTVHPQSVDAFFAEAQRRRLRMICGKVMMDRNCPDFLRDASAASSYEESKALIERWHGVDRLLYAVTPRFAPTSTPEQLRLAGQLLAEHPTVYLHTHLSENKQEVAWVESLFGCGYLEAYTQAELLRPRSVFAHCIHLTRPEYAAMKAHDCSVAWCPLSNMFLGSGCFDYGYALRQGVRVGLGTDVGAGTSFSMLKVQDAVYKSEQLRRGLQLGLSNEKEVEDEEKEKVQEESPRSDASTTADSDVVTDEVATEAAASAPEQEADDVAVVKPPPPGGLKLSPLSLFYLSTLGGAKALHLDDRLGSFAAGKEADFVLLDLKCTELMARRVAAIDARMARAAELAGSTPAGVDPALAKLQETLFVLSVLGDDRTVRKTFVLGEQVYDRDVGFAGAAAKK